MKTYFKDPKIEWLGNSGVIHDPNGVLLLFEQYDKHAEYYIGADVGGGLGLSNSVAHVLKAGDMNNPDRQVAEWASNYHSPTEFAHVLNTLGLAFWNTHMELPACLNVEANNYGHTTIATLVETLDYMNLYQNIDQMKVNKKHAPQWGTTVLDKTRVPLVMLGESRLKNGQWEVWSPYFIEEMADFQITNIKHIDALEKEILADQGKAAGRLLDDRLFAGFHALWACNAMNPDIMLDRERRRMRREKEAVDKESREGQVELDWRNTDCTYEQMMREQDILG